MKKLGWIGIVLVFVFSLAACGSQEPQEIVSEALGVDASTGSTMSSMDTHSGNGDGTSFVVLHFDGDEMIKQIKADAAWQPFPLDETVQTLVYGVSDATSSIGPFLTDEDGKALVSEIANGYYRLIDRQVEEDQATGADILNRASFNFTVGLYDTDTNTLYCCELDT
ncbi:MAG TPA: hypothetical protein H9842_04795 [Candidatus Agathobaculum merdipullorum]|nr:hypothetical protein [Candidatus Agathobaculum merdipullorum]